MIYRWGFIYFFLGLFFYTNQGHAQVNALSLSEALQRTAQFNLSLAQYPFHQQQQQALRAQANIKPPPRIKLSAENMLGTGDMQDFNDAEMTLMLGQLIELGDKSTARIALAAASEQKMQAEYEVLRLDIFAETSKRFYQALKLQALADLSLKRIQQEQHALSLLQTQAKAGAVSDREVAKMALHLAQAKMHQTELTDEQAQVRLRLSRLWQARPDFTHVKGELLQLPQLPKESVLLSQLDKSPAVFLQQALVRLAKSQWKVESSLSRADLNLSAGVKYRPHSTDTGFNVMLEIPLHFNSPNSGRVEAAESAQRLSYQQQADNYQQLVLHILEIHQQTLALQRQIKRIKASLLPEAKSLLAATEKALAKGQASVMQWVDAEDELDALERSLIEKHWLIYMNLLEIERITGLSIVAATSPRRLQ